MTRIRTYGCYKAATALLFAVTVVVLVMWYSGRNTTSIRQSNNFHHTLAARQPSTTRDMIRQCVERQQHPCSQLSGHPPWPWANYARLLDKINATDQFLEDLQLRKAITLGFDEGSLWTSLIFCMRTGSTHMEETMSSSHYSSDPKEVSLTSEPGLKVTREDFDGVEVIVYRPMQQRTGLRGGLVYIHGGGWVAGRAEYRGKLCELLALQADIVIINVNYRLAPEFKYPVPLNDCIRATKYTLANARRFGIDVKRIAVGGDSSGGNLAAAVILRARDETWIPALKAQVLFYPPLQVINFNTPSYQRFRCNGARLDQPTMVSFWLLYAFGDVTPFRLIDFCQNLHATSTARAQYGGYVDVSLLQNVTRGRDFLNARADDELWGAVRDIFTDPYFAPLMAKDFHGLPSTFVATVERDVLTTEGLLYVERLRKAGVSIQHRHYNASHGQLVYTFLDVTTNMAADVSLFLKVNL